MLALATFIIGGASNPRRRQQANNPPPVVPIAPGVLKPVISNGANYFPQHEDPRETAALDLWFATGGRGVDTAWNYYNQQVVGWALQPGNTTLRRDEIFLTTKIPCVGSAELALEYIKQDIAQLQTRPDLVLIHSPGFVGPAPVGQPSGCWGHEPCCQNASQLQATYHGLELALAQNLTRAIGVSNHRTAQLQTILATAKIPPAINQCQLYVGQHDDDTISFCKSHGIHYEAYSPLGPWQPYAPGKNGTKKVLADPVVKQIAAAHNLTAAQIGLRWVAQLGHTMVTASASKQYDSEDLAIFGFALSDEEMAQLDAVRAW